MLDTAVPVDEAVVELWRARVRAALALLGWPEHAIVARRHAGAVTLGFEAPVDQLFTATEANEWALCSALVAAHRATAAELDAALAHAAEVNPLPEARAVGLAPTVEQDAAFVRLRALADKERDPLMRALLDAARARGLPWLLDDDALTLGHGAGGATYPLDALPRPDAVAWARLSAIPLAVVTGSNGKTTTVRLIAAALDASGKASGHSCTDGVFVAGEAIGSGDYSGPAGARRVLRDRRAEAAVIETARGGILRRGLAVARADAAVVTNVSADHFGEYGVHGLDDLASAKLAVAALVKPAPSADGGLLVLNADDPLLRERGRALARRQRVGWAALELADAEAAAGDAAAPTCGARAGRLILCWQGEAHDLGAVADLPLTAGGAARYNQQNLAAAALAAAACGVPPLTIARLFARFGADPEDNAGRLMRYALGGLTLFIDYAHNAEGLAGLLAVAEAARGAGSHRGRLVLLLGHAGNRQGTDFERLAATAAAADPDFVVIKEIESYTRGREPGEVPALLRAALVANGMAEARLAVEPSEALGVRHALLWARAGDVVVLPVHGLGARRAALELIDRLRARGWSAGQALP